MADTNVLLVVLDDCRKDLLPYMGFTNGQLRREGIEFTSMRCPVPVCSPVRAGLMTGRDAFRAENLVYRNSPATDAAGVATHTLPIWLKTAGVASTGLFGKYTIPGQTTKPNGWDTWRCLSSSTQAAYGYTIHDGTTPTTPAGHQLTYLASEVTTFVTTATQPWFCYFAPTNPHVNVTDFGNNPLPSSSLKFDWVDWPLDLLTSTTDKPSWITALAQMTPNDQALLRVQIRQQLREAHDADAVIQQIYNSLSSSGRLADTLIIVISDSGVFYGEQRLDLGGIPSIKDHPYDSVAKVPSIMRGPGVRAGSSYTHPTKIQDVTATVSSFFGATPTTSLDGVDLRALVNTPQPSRGTLYEKGAGDPTYPDGSGVVTATRKLLKWTGKAGTDEYEMYDLDTDPGEKINVANIAGRLTERNTLEAARVALLV